MTFFKIIIIWLLLFVSGIALRLSYLEAEVLHAYGTCIWLAIGAIANLILVLVSFRDDVVNPDTQSDNSNQSSD